MIKKAFIFDYDDTLVATRDSKFTAVKAVAERYYGVVISDAEIAQHWGVPYRDFFFELFGPYDSDIDGVILKYESVDKEFPILPFSDCKQTLEILGKKALLGIVSSCRREVIIRQLKAMGLNWEIFSYIQGEEDSQFHKPDPRVFDRLLCYLKDNECMLSQIWYFGDSMKDFLAAKEAGLNFIGLDRISKETELMVSHGAHVVDSLSCIVDLVGMEIQENAT
jgi:phosphoglycolate phosphatase